MSLLEQAKKIPAKRIIHAPITKEDIELALAWLSNEIGIQQFRRIKKDQTGHYKSYSFILVCLREAYLKGLLKIK